MKKYRKVSHHHIRPRSRGGGDEKENIKLTTQAKHDAFNLLFGSNALPEEAVMILINDWWYQNKNQKIKTLHQLDMDIAKLIFKLLGEK